MEKPVKFHLTDKISFYEYHQVVTIYFARHIVLMEFFQ